MAEIRVLDHASVEEYQALNDASEVKLEYINGEIIEMAGVSPAHERIVMNLIRLLLKAGMLPDDTELCTSDTRVAIPNSDTYFYPDLSIVRGAFIYNNDRPQSLLNPSILIEVTSVSNDFFYLTQKLVHFKRIETVTDILYINSVYFHIEHYSRKGADWQTTIFDAVSGTISIPALCIELPVPTIYKNIVYNESQKLLEVAQS